VPIANRARKGSLLSSLLITGILGCQTVPQTLPLGGGGGAAAPLTGNPAQAASPGAIPSGASVLERAFLVDIDPIQGSALERSGRTSLTTVGTLQLAVTFPRVRHDVAAGRTTVTLHLENGSVALAYLQGTGTGDRPLLGANPFRSAALAPGAAETIDLTFDNPAGAPFTLGLAFTGVLAPAPLALTSTQPNVNASGASPSPSLVPAPAGTPIAATAGANGQGLPNTPTPGPSTTLTPAPAVTRSPSSAPTASPSQALTPSPTPTPTPTPTGTPTATPTPVPTPTPTPFVTLPPTGTSPSLVRDFSRDALGADPADFIDPNDEGFTYSWMPRVKWRVALINGAKQFLHDGLSTTPNLAFRRYRGTGLGTANGQLPNHYVAELDVTPIQSDTYTPTGDQGTQFYYIDPTHYIELLIKPTFLEVWECNGAAPFQSVGWTRLFAADATTGANQTRHLRAEIDCQTHMLKAYFDGQLLTTLSIDMLTTQPHYFALRGTGNIVAHNNIHIQSLP
jgi:hypothetical protein